MNTLVLYSSRLKTLQLLLTSIFFTIAGGIMVQSGVMVGWFPAIFFGMCSLISMIKLIKNSWISLTSEGFEVKSLYRSSFTRWDEVEYFEARYVGTLKMVTMTYSSKYTKAKTARKVAYALTNREGALPETYGKSAEELAILLNTWKKKHARLTEK